MNYVQLRYKIASLNSHCQNIKLTVQCTGKYACFERISCLTLYNPLQHDTHSHSHTFYQRHLRIWSANVIVENICLA